MKKRYIIIALSILILGACTDKYEEYNRDRKNPPAVPAEATFTYALLELSDQISSTNVNLNVWKLWAQYWTETTYIDEANYDILNRTVADLVFRQLYRNVLKNFSEASEALAMEEPVLDNDIAAKSNKQAVIEILEVYTYHRLIDIFGDIPYSEAIDDDVLAPVFDDAFGLYQALAAKLQAASAVLAASSSTDSWGPADPIYNGDTEAWLKFAAGLSVKMGISIIDHQPALAMATQMIQQGMAGAFTSAADDALLPYGSSFPNTNTLYEDLVLSGRQDFVAANTVVDIMNALDDPRREFYFQLTDTSTETGVEKPAYVGGPYGYPSPYSQYSHVGEVFHEATFNGILMTYSELLFYYAEAAQKGIALGGTADSYYQEAITESIMFWAAQYGRGDGAALATAYLANADVAIGATGNELEQIATQSWLGSYSRGFLGYTTWRRLDYPIFNLPERTDNHADIPKRFTYPVYEQTLNGPNWTAAVEKMNPETKEDLLTIPLFWDKNPANVPPAE